MGQDPSFTQAATEEIAETLRGIHEYRYVIGNKIPTTAEEWLYMPKKWSSNPVGTARQIVEEEVDETWVATDDYQEWKVHLWDGETVRVFTVEARVEIDYRSHEVTA